MSLISEALRKARQQAAEEGDQRGGVLYSWSPATRPRGTRLGLGLVLGAMIALGAALAGAGAVWWVVGHRGQSETAALPSSPQPAAPADSSEDQLSSDTSPDAVGPSPPSAPLATERTSSEDQGLPLGHTRDQTAEPPRDAPVASLSGLSRPTPGADPDATTRQSDRPARGNADPPTIGPDGERIYLIEADLGGVALILDFIVYRADDPFAQINGLDVRVGSTIEGFTVEAIERNQVRLRDEHGILILRAP